MTLKTPLFDAKAIVAKRKKPVSQRARRILMLIVTAPVFGAALALWTDWHARGGYEPVGYYLANSWTAWGATDAAAGPALPPVTSVAKR